MQIIRQAVATKLVRHGGQQPFWDTLSEGLRRPGYIHRRLLLVGDFSLIIVIKSNTGGTGLLQCEMKSNGEPESCNSV